MKYFAIICVIVLALLILSNALAPTATALAVDQFIQITGSFIEFIGELFQDELKEELVNQPSIG